MASGVDPAGVCVPRSLILRPDHVEGALPWWRTPRTAALQKIVGGLRRGIFYNTTEEGFRQIIHHEALKRAGLPWPPYEHEPDLRWWSRDKLRQAENRRMYHGLRLFSLFAINRLIGQLIEEAADRDAIRAARRFALYYREYIYRAAASAPPRLAVGRHVSLGGSRHLRRFLRCTMDRPLCGVGSVVAESEARAATAVRLTKRGARLREVAAALEIPMALRRVKPGVAHLVTPFLVQHPDLLQWMPNETPAARIWLTSVGFAGHRDADFGRWVARHVSEIPGRLQQVGHTIGDVSDWVHANTQGNGRQFVTRRFTPSMALRTAIQASHEWHEAVASHMDDAGDLALPPPWYPPATQGGFDIVPLTTSADLYREGHAMHHCVATYVDAGSSRHFLHLFGSQRRQADRDDFPDLPTARASRSNNCADHATPHRPRPSAAAVRQWLRAQRTTAAAIRQQYEEWSRAAATVAHRARPQRRP